MKHPSEANPISISLRPRGLRPPAAATYLGVSPFAIEEAWRSGALKYREVAGQRVSTTDQLDAWFNSHEEKSGKLDARGIHLAKVGS